MNCISSGRRLRLAAAKCFQRSVDFTVDDLMNSRQLHVINR